VIELAQRFSSAMLAAGYPVFAPTWDAGGWTRSTEQGSGAGSTLKTPPRDMARLRCRAALLEGRSKGTMSAVKPVSGESRSGSWFRAAPISRDVT
jgi:hypothetical protein